jgi:hypothetical protein
LTRVRRKGALLTAGDCIDERFLLRQELGEGGFGTVWLASDLDPSEPGARVAVKILHAHLAGDRAFVERFRAAAKTMQALHHEHIVRVIQPVRTWERFHYFVMSYVDGDLSAAAETGIPRHEALSLLLQAGRALHHAHRKGVVHGDVKPSNVLYTAIPEPQAWLADFDLFRWLGHTETVGRDLAQVFSAPERLTGGRTSIKGDIYGFALTICFVLSGGRVVPRASSTEYVRLVNPPAPLLFPLLAALAEDPLRRMEDLAALLDALEQSLRDPEPVWPPARAKVDDNWAFQRWVVGLGDEELAEVRRLADVRLGDGRWRQRFEGCPDTAESRWDFADYLSGNMLVTMFAEQVESALREGTIPNITIGERRPLSLSEQIDALMSCRYWQLEDATQWLGLRAQVFSGTSHFQAALSLIDVVRRLGRERELTAYIEHGLEKSDPAPKGHALRLSLLARGTVVWTLLRGWRLVLSDPQSFLSGAPNADELQRAYMGAVETNWAQDPRDFVWLHDVIRKLEALAASDGPDVQGWSPMDSEAVLGLDHGELEALLDAFVPTELRPDIRRSPLERRSWVADILALLPSSGAARTLVGSPRPVPPLWSGPWGDPVDWTPRYDRLAEIMERLSADQLDAFVAQSPLGTWHIRPRESGVILRTDSILHVLMKVGADLDAIEALVDRVARS